MQKPNQDFPNEPIFCTQLEENPATSTLKNEPISALETTRATPTCDRVSTQATMPPPLPSQFGTIAPL